MHILLAEDNRADVFLVEEGLKLHGVAATLQVVSDGDAAIDYLSRVEAGEVSPVPHLIVLDLNLPRKSGHDVLAHIRKSPKLGGIPVLIATSSNAQTDRLQAEQLRANAFFSKPSSYESFLNIGLVIKSLLA